jgi:hypothetical protein
LRCQAHNQYEAERAFGAEFMTRKRQAAQQRAAASARKKPLDERVEEVIPWLRQLGFTAQEARWRAERCESVLDAPLEERVRLALSYVGPRGRATLPSCTRCARDMTRCNLEGGGARPLRRAIAMATIMLGPQDSSPNSRSFPAALRSSAPLL